MMVILFIGGHDLVCKGCETWPIFGTRYECKTCSVDLCQLCMNDKEHSEHEVNTWFDCDQCYLFDECFNCSETKNKHRRNAHQCNFCNEVFEGRDFKRRKIDHIRYNHMEGERFFLYDFNFNHHSFLPTYVCNVYLTDRPIHYVTCKGCETYPIIGIRYNCKTCNENFCQECKNEGKHSQHSPSAFCCHRMLLDEDALRDHQQKYHKCNFCSIVFDSRNCRKQKLLHLQQAHEGDLLL